MKIRKLKILFSLLLLFGSAALFSSELYTTTADLILSSPHVAHVRVEDSQSILGGRVIEYRLTVLETLKGTLPAEISVRLSTGTPSLHGGDRPALAGREWILILGGKNEFDVYPIRSVELGKIDVIVNEETGERVLASSVTGMGDERSKRGRKNLRDFRAMVTDVLKRGKSDARSKRRVRP